MKTSWAAILLPSAAGILILATAGRSPLAQPEAQPPRSLDDQLLDDLGADPLDDLDRELFGPGDAAGKPGAPPGEGPEDPGTRLRRELGVAAVAEDADPLLDVARRMRDVEGRIARNDSGLTTQGLQRQIIDDLDRLIEQARKSCQGSKSGTKPSNGPSFGQPKQGEGGTKPSEKPAPAGNRKTAGQSHKPDTQQMREMVQKLWEVALPPQQSEQLLQQSPFDEFLPKYDALIEQYFRRLSEDNDQEWQVTKPDWQMTKPE